MSDPGGIDISKLGELATTRLPDLTRHFRPMSSPFPQIPTFKNIAEQLAEDQYASEFQKRLHEMIAEFEEALDPEQEVGVRLVSFGQTVVFHLEGIGYYNPSLIRFVGRTEGGEPVELIQHVSQISVLLMRLPALDPENPRRIGFHEDKSGEPEEG